MSLSENDARGIDFISEYFNPFLEQCEQRQQGRVIATCDTEWQPDGHETPWHCMRAESHTGLHASLIPIPAFDSDRGVTRVVVTIGAMWANEGVLQR
jgi:hypothetical protein